MRIKIGTTLLALMLITLLSWSAGAAVLAEDEGSEPVVVEKTVVLTAGDGDTTTWTTEDGKVIMIKGDCKMDVLTDDEQKIVVKVCAGEPGELHNLMLLGEEPVNRTFLGVALNSLTPELRVHFGAGEGTGVMVASVVEGSPAEAAGLQVGDVITAINGTAATSSSAIQKAVREMNEGDTALVEVLRDGSPMDFKAVLATKEFPGCDFDFDFDFDHLSDMEGLQKYFVRMKTGNGEFSFDTDSLDQAMEKLNQYLEGPEFEALIEQHGVSGDAIEKRIEVLERRVEEIE